LRKYVLLCGDKRREIDCAVPRNNPVVAINVRVGVGEDRAKRIKEFAQGGEGMRRYAFRRCVFRAGARKGQA